MLAAPAAAATAFFAAFGLALGLTILAPAPVDGDAAGGAVFFASAVLVALFLHLSKSFTNSCPDA